MKEFLTSALVLILAALGLCLGLLIGDAAISACNLVGVKGISLCRAGMPFAGCLMGIMAAFKISERWN